jgi:hypothetical protein
MRLLKSTGCVVLPEPPGNRPSPGVAQRVLRYTEAEAAFLAALGLAVFLDPEKGTSDGTL